MQTLKDAGVQMDDIALHFHDTYGQALVNTIVGLEHGVRVFDSSVGGLGGCPYSKGATGNVATEDLVHLLHSLGMQTGVDTVKMAETAEWICGVVGRSNEGRRRFLAYYPGLNYRQFDMIFSRSISVSFVAETNPNSNYQPNARK